MQNRTILVVDDSPNIRRLLAHNLGKKFTVLTAGDGQAALDILKNGNGINLLVVDIAMPGIDGFALTERIKENPACSTIPLIMLTAKDTSEDREKGLMLGAVEYITKPFNLEELGEKIEAILNP
ncbi:MAG: response regulator [Chlorobiaceae bacterium]|nr:response regulator [Chlorobiaceae bacterium]NTV61111.1 response regulator [Chlorobiaceae bacterium]